MPRPTPEVVSHSFQHVYPDVLVSGKSMASLYHPRRNDDRIFFDHRRKIALLLDGSSGSDDASQSSELAEDYLRRNLDYKEPQLNLDMHRLKAYLEAGAFYLAGVGDSTKTDLRSTALAVKTGTYYGQDIAIHAHIGDSPLYLYREGDLTKVTEEHNLLNASLLPISQKREISRALDEVNSREGLQALIEQDPLIETFFDEPSWVVQILGRRETILPDRSRFSLDLMENTTVNATIGFLEMFPGDVLILASDGIKNLSLSDMRKLLESCEPLAVAETLANAAFLASANYHNFRAEPDDITVLAEVIRKKQRFRGWDQG